MLYIWSNLKYKRRQTKEKFLYLVKSNRMIDHDLLEH